MKLVRENINEKFKEESDPIKDMNIGTVCISDIAKKTIQNKKIRNGSHEWYIYLNSLIGKKITGKFLPVYRYINNRKRKVNEYTIIIKNFRSYNEGTEIILETDAGDQYIVQKNERYIIR